MHAINGRGRGRATELGSRGTRACGVRLLGPTAARVGWGCGDGGMPMGRGASHVEGGCDKTGTSQPHQAGPPSSPPSPALTPSGMGRSRPAYMSPAARVPRLL